jgi:hypothetical protein
MRKFALRRIVVAAAIAAWASAGVASDALARASGRFVQPGGDRGGYVTETWPETGEYVDTTVQNCSWLGGGHRSAYVCR